MKVFSSCTIVLQFDSLTSFKDKVSWRKKVTDNGGVVSYVLTKKASFLVVFNAKSASCSFKIRQSHRHNIPIVGPKYVDQCLTRKRLLDINSFKLTDENNNERFNKGKIIGEQSTVLKQRKKKRTTVNLGIHTSWMFGDVDAPKFDEEKFELPKWSLLVDKDLKTIQVLEVHVSTDGLFEKKYRLYAQTGSVADKKVTSVEEGIVWYFESVDAAISGYEQLYRRYSTSPVNMIVCQSGSVDVAELGSTKFRMVIGKLSLLNERISPQVAALTDHIWKAALVEVDSLLQVPMQYIKEKQIEEGRMALAKLSEKLVSGDGNLTTLYEEFYEAIPYKAENRSNKWTLKDVVIKQDLCQLLADILSVSESTDWSTDATVIAKYQALGCHISLLTESDKEILTLSNNLKHNLGEGGSVHNIYQVRRTIEEVNFQSDIGDVQMLTHASHYSNYLGIISRGLILPNVVTDKMGVSRTDAGLLGAGIYFAADARKSAFYSSPCQETGTRLLLLCDVALGQKYTLTEPNTNLAAPPDGYDSVHGIKHTEDKKSYFQDDEYAIYNPNQKCIRYLVEFSLPNDDVNNQIMTDDMDIVTDILPVVKTSTPMDSIDIKDVRNVPDPLCKIKAGLQGNKKEHVPLKSVHVRAQLMDMISQVVVLQAYRNDNKKTIEAKYVFPLDCTAAVCGFEAFINGKHVIGEVKEKAKARKEYREAVSKGHGAYLMEEETPDVFSVSVGNLPPNSDVLIKITYIAELQVDGEAICFSLPAAVAPWLRDGSLAQNTQSSTSSVKVLNNKKCEISVQVSLEMPSDIRKIYSPTHKINLKKTATKAVVSLPRKSSLDNGFQLNVYLAEIHVPRMWVERHPEYNTQACMLTFYPEFETTSELDPEIIILLDMSNSMKSESEEQAKKVALLLLDSLPAGCQFNIITFGSTFEELFPSTQKYSKVSIEIAKKHIQDCSAKMGSTDIWSPLHATQMLCQSNNYTSNLFVISDGHVTQESQVVKETKKALQRNRVFTLGVGSTLNNHLLRTLAVTGGGTFEYYNVDTKSLWQRKINSQIEKACQAGLSDVHVDWLQTNEDAPIPVQAPNQIPCLFSGCRQVVYGFVESSMQATLKAKTGRYNMTTMVSTTDLHVTTGEILHRLTARAVISDNENGILDDDKIKHEVLKADRKQYIIDLSKKFSIVTPYTSFVAVEDRSKDNIVVESVPSIADLVAKETVDILPYIGFDSGEEEEEKNPEVYVSELLQRGEVAEGFSMVQAEETYTELDSYISTIINNAELAQKVYTTLSRFYRQNQAQSVGDIISQIEPTLDRDRPKCWKKKRMRCKFSSLSTLNGSLNPPISAGDGNMITSMSIPVEMPALMPPEVTIDQEQVENIMAELENLPDLPDFDEALLDLRQLSKTQTYLKNLDYNTAFYDPKLRSCSASVSLPKSTEQTNNATVAGNSYVNPGALDECLAAANSTSGTEMEKKRLPAPSICEEFPGTPEKTPIDNDLAVQELNGNFDKGQHRIIFGHDAVILDCDEDDSDIEINNDLEQPFLFRKKAELYTAKKVDNMSIKDKKPEAHEPDTNASIESTPLQYNTNVPSTEISTPSTTMFKSMQKMSAKPYARRIRHSSYLDSDNMLQRYSAECNVATSPTYIRTSPRLPPTSLAQSPTSPRLLPTVSAHSPIGPAYSPTSPAYSPTSPAYSPTSPAYSPTSHAYSPTSPAYIKPSQCLPSTAQCSSSPSKLPISTTYLPTSTTFSFMKPSCSRKNSAHLSPIRHDLLNKATDNIQVQDQQMGQGLKHMMELEVEQTNTTLTPRRDQQIGSNLKQFRDHLSGFQIFQNMSQPLVHHQTSSMDACSISTLDNASVHTMPTYPLSQIQFASQVGGGGNRRISAFSMSETVDRMAGRGQDSAKGSFGSAMNDSLPGGKNIQLATKAARQNRPCSSVIIKDLISRGKQIECKAARRASDDKGEDDDDESEEVEGCVFPNTKDLVAELSSGSIEPSYIRRRSRSSDRSRSRNRDRNRSRNISRDRYRNMSRDRSGSRNRDIIRCRDRVRTRNMSRNGSWGIQIQSKDRDLSRRSRWGISGNTERHIVNNDIRRRKSMERSTSNTLDRSRSRTRVRSTRSRSSSRYRRSRSTSRSKRSRSRDRSRRSRSRDRSRRSRSRSRSRSRVRSRRSRSRDRSMRSRSRDRSRRSRSRDRSRRSRSRSRPRRRSNISRSMSMDRRTSRSSSRSSCMDKEEYIQSSYRGRMRSRHRSISDSIKSRRQKTPRSRSLSSVSTGSWRRSRSYSERRSRRRTRISRSYERSGSLIWSSHLPRKTKKVSRIRSSSRSTRSSNQSIKRGDRDELKVARVTTRIVRNSETGRWERKEIISEKPGMTDDSSQSAALTFKADEVFHVDQSNVWSGVVTKEIEDVEMAYHEIVIMLQDGQSNYDLTDKLCCELGLSSTRIIKILEEQGIRSLGEKRVQLIHQILASLLVIIFMVKVQYREKYNRPLLDITNMSITNPVAEGDSFHIVNKPFTYRVADVDTLLVLHGHETIQLPHKMLHVLTWLEEQERCLPPLYKVLELGNTKTEFISNVCKMFENV